MRSTRRATVPTVIALSLILVAAAVGPVQGEGAPAAEGPSGPLVASKNEKLSVTLGGRIHRMVQVVDDGKSATTLFTDAEQGPTTMKVDVKGEPSSALSVGATLEVAIQQNRPFKVSQDARDGGIDITGRIAEVFIDVGRGGKFSLGRGFAASWLAPEIDLSMTQFAALLPVGMLSPGLKFVDSTADTLSDIQVSLHFVDVERLLIQDRFRYDSPRLSGLRASGTVAADNRWDVALRNRHATSAFTVVGGASYQSEPFPGIDTRWDVGISLRHEPTGVSVTGGYSSEELQRGTRATSYVAKIGWLADLVALGKTAFAVDYYETHDLRVDDDTATSFGVIAVQKWPAYGIDFYLGVRRYDVDRPDISLRPLFVVPIGLVLDF